MPGEKPQCTTPLGGLRRFFPQVPAKAVETFFDFELAGAKKAAQKRRHLRPAFTFSLCLRLPFERTQHLVVFQDLELDRVFLG